MNSFLSFDDEFDNVSVTKLPKTDREHSKTNTSIKSPIRRSDDDDDIPTERPFKRQGAVRVARIYSAKKLRPLSLDSLNGVRPSIVENTIHLDRCEVKKRKDKVRVKRIFTAHRKSGIEHRPSQVDTIELSTTMAPILETTSVRSESKSNASFNVTVKRIVRGKSAETQE